MNKLLLMYFATLFLLGNNGEVNGQILDLIKLVSNICLSHEMCNTGFFDFKNYCCFRLMINAQCCNMVTFVLQKNDNNFDNLLETFRQPRAINIILCVVVLLVLMLLIRLVLAFCCRWKNQMFAKKY